MTSNNQDEPEEPSRLIDASAEIAGGVVGVSIGLAIAGPVGALAGGAAAPLVTRTIRKLAMEFQSRVLSPRETIRVNTVFAIAAAKVESNRDRGLHIRQDGFFIDELESRSAGEEIMEGVLLVAQREYEERKLRYYGNLLANIAFRPDVDRPLANLLIRVADNLSYRQMCLLSIFVQKDKYDLNSDRSISSISRKDIVQDIHDMCQKGIFPRIAEENSFPLDVLQIYRIIPESLGMLMYELMNLDEMPNEEVDKVVVFLLPASQASDT